jgi:hypothetical protein
LPGIFNEILQISKSGVSGSLIKVEGRAGAIVDLQNSTSLGVRISGSYVELSRLRSGTARDLC